MRPFRRARIPVAVADTAAVVERDVRLALDDTAPTSARLAALGRLEHAPPKSAAEIARRLVAALAAPADVAARAHVVLLVLEPDLAIGRAADGALVGAVPLLPDLPSDGVVAHVDPVIGRVVALDQLTTLYGPEESVPLFLSAAPLSGPAPYRPPQDVLARQREAQQRAAERALWQEKMRAFGLSEDDLEDDVEERLSAGERLWVPRRDAGVVVRLEGAQPVALVVGQHIVALGTAHAGAWWADVRTGDRRGAQRFIVRLERDQRSVQPRVRRTRRLEVRDGVVTLQFGDERVEHVVAAREVVCFIEEDVVGGAAFVVGLTIAWASRAPRVVIRAQGAKSG